MNIIKRLINKLLIKLRFRKEPVYEESSLLVKRWEDYMRKDFERPQILYFNKFRKNNKPLNNIIKSNTPS